MSTDKSDVSSQGVPWCEPCGSYHVTPKDAAHKAMLKCVASVSSQGGEQELLPCPCAWCGVTPEDDSDDGDGLNAVKCVTSICPVRSHGWMSLKSWLHLPTLILHLHHLLRNRLTGSADVNRLAMEATRGKD